MNKIDCVIRPGQLDDFDQIDSFDPFAGDRRQEIAEERCIVAEFKQQIIGYVVFHTAGFIGRPFIHFLAVKIDYRRCRIATLLLEAVRVKIGSGRLFISTEVDNSVMLRLFKTQGWTPAGCVEGVNDEGKAECFFYQDLSEQDLKE